MKSLLTGLVLLGAAVAVISCGQTSKPCGPTTCSGCCDLAGACQVTATTSACGANGATCASCIAGQVCSAAGSCIGGGGGGTGGGTAGGSGGGGTAGGSGGGSGGGGTAGGSGGGTAGGSGGGSGGGAAGGSGGGSGGGTADSGCVVAPSGAGLLDYTDDADGDGRSDLGDNCPFASNRDQLDSDGDGVGDACDNCVSMSNFSQLDTDGDASGDVCDGDLDGDGITNSTDNCPTIPNTNQLNTDGDGQGNACDTDDDNDGFVDTIDLCPIGASATNVVHSGACGSDGDGDGVDDSVDDCLGVSNVTQQDTDGDGLGDVCDFDRDNDGVLNQADNCVTMANRSQTDSDGDGQGDACDAVFCVVIDPAHPTSCLNPATAFQVSAGGSLSLNTGEVLSLPLFANRADAGIAYTWSVQSKPAASHATVVNPSGVATNTKRFQYSYWPQNPVAVIRPDVAGNYQVRLDATLAGTSSMSSDVLSITATGPATICQ